MATIKFKRLGEHGLPLPSRGNEFAAGVDMAYAGESTVIAAGQRKLLKSGFSVMLPAGHYGRIAPRSGLAYKHGIDVMAGVIDIDYRGEVGIILYNTSEKDFIVSFGDKIAQLVVEAISYASPELVDELPETDRGEGGYGSTGHSVLA
ncbi:dUTP pyrophosphatase [Sinobacterium caligoides]|uniref:dUTP diphosphatase n=1 Tax=Sinobacterium caligoides TaxID=933926 RepID=A0A3N2DJV7_9GAMM|nr:dUTP diphosphatase [Sinobacterium caligoides]ROS00081.1 dUTP pyrophosphatase [Sinobacterium caligoides]